MSTRGEAVPELQEETQDGVGELEPSLEAPSEEIDNDESATESLERFLGSDAEGLLSGDKSEKPAEEAPKEQANELEGDKEEKPEEIGEDIDPELLPPQRFSAKAKQAFINAPKGVRRELNRAVRELEGQFTRANQQASQALQEWQPMRQAIAPYTQKWAAQGVSEVAGILQLCAAQERLTDPNLEVREDEFFKLAGRARLDKKRLAERLLGYAPSGGTGQVSQHPAQEYAESQNSTLRAEISELRSQLQQAIAAPLTSEMEQARNETDPTHGRLLRPALHDEAFLLSLKPRVAELVGTTPGLSYGAALKQAHDERVKSWFGDSYQPNPTRFLASGTNTTTRAAAVSIRGKPVPQATNGEYELPPGVKDDARSSLAHFFGR